MVIFLKKHRFMIIGIVFLTIVFSSLQTNLVSAQEIVNPTESILNEVPAHRETILELIHGEKTISDVISDVCINAIDELRTVLSDGKMLIIVLLLFGIKNMMEFPQSLNRTVFLGCFSCVSLLTGEVFFALVTLARDLLSHLSQFVYLCIPALTGLIANGGRVLSAAKSTYFILSFMNVIVFLIERFFFPLILLYYVFTVISALIEKDYFSAVKKAISSLIKVILPLFIGIFMTFLSIFTSISKSADELTLKSAKMALGTCIPFLGGVLTESGEYLVQTVSHIKSQAGAAGILVLIYIFLFPIIRLLSGFVLFKLLSVAACLLGEKDMTTFFEETSGAVGMLCGSLAAVSVIAILGMMILMGI